MRERKRQFDPRLIGTWKSDRRRTFRHWKPRPGCSPQSERKFKALFGKLIVRWTPTKCHWDCSGSIDSGIYHVVARDSDSVVVWLQESLSGKPQLLQIHFEDDYYWIALTGGLCEYFRRIPSPSVGQEPQRGQLPQPDEKGHG